jgi:hypothetical protein
MKKFSRLNKSNSLKYKKAIYLNLGRAILGTQESIKIEKSLCLVRCQWLMAIILLLGRQR